MKKSTLFSFFLFLCTKIPQFEEYPLLLIEKDNVFSKRVSQYCFIKGLKVIKKDVKDIKDLSIYPAVFSSTSAFEKKIKEKLTRYIKEGGNLFLAGPLKAEALEFLKQVGIRVLSSKKIKVKEVVYTENSFIHSSFRGVRIETDSFSIHEIGGKDIEVLAHVEGMPVFIFKKYGKGGIFYTQLLPKSAEESIIDALSTKEHNPFEYPILVAIDAIYKERVYHAKENYFNITVDDVPAPIEPLLQIGGGDFQFTEEEVSNFLRYIREKRVHVDFAWIPNNFELPEKIMDLIKKAGVGFVQHGFFMHLNSADDPCPNEHAILGEEAVKFFERKYDVRVQKVFVYPGCLGPEETLKILKALNFLYSVNGQLYPPPIYYYNMLKSKKRIPSFLYGSMPFSLAYRNFPLALRYVPEGAKKIVESEKYLTVLRARALLAMGLPIFVYIHALDVKLNFDCIDWVIEFCKKYNIKSASLEEIGRRHYWIRKYKDLYVIPLYTRSIILKNDSEEQRKYLIVKEERDSKMINAVYVREKKIKPFQRDGKLLISLVLEPQEETQIEIEYKSEEIYKKAKRERFWSMILDFWSTFLFLFSRGISYIISNV